MKKLILIILLIPICCFSSPGQGVWKLGDKYAGGSLSNSYKNNFIAYGDDLFLYYGQYFIRKQTGNTVEYIFYYFIKSTFDGGKTWRFLMDELVGDSLLGVKFTDKDFEFSSIYFFPPTTLQFCHYGTGNIYKTYDWGAHWIKQDVSIIKQGQPSTGLIYYPLDSMRQVGRKLLGSNTYGYKPNSSYVTHDGWKTWDSVKMHGNLRYRGAGIFSDCDLVMVNDSVLVSTLMYTDKVYYTSNKGRSWDSIRLPGENPDQLFGGGFTVIPNKNIVFMTGGRRLATNSGNIIIWKSIDAGKNWKVCLDTKDSVWIGGGRMDMNEEGIGAVVGQGDRTPGETFDIPPAYLTSDYGETWTKTPFDSTSRGQGNTLACKVASLKNMWAFLSGALYRYYPDGLSRIDGEPGESSSLIGDVYPNPAQKGQRIYLRLSKDIEIGSGIKVYSLLGNQIDEIILQNPENTISYLPASNLPAGSYYFLIETGNTKITKHFILK